MLKLLLVTTLVIYSLSIPQTIARPDDEFAEFDDFSQSDSLSKPPDHQLDQPSENLAKDSLERETPISNNDNPRVEESKSLRDNEEKEDDTSESDKKDKPDLKLVDVPVSPKFYPWESYYVEIAFIFASFLYFVNYFVGCNSNHKFAHQWYEHTREILKQQFALVGGSPQLNDGPRKTEEDADSNPFASIKKQRGLIKSTESLYTIWNSGRIGMDGLLVEISLLKRQDLFSMALNLLKPSQDSIILRFLLSQDGYENFVFCLANKSQAPKLARDMVDINTFCPKRKPLSQYGIDIDRLFVMSELSDVTSFMFDQKTTAFLKKYERSINYIHITDQYSTQRSEEMLPAQKLANSKRMATFSFVLPQTNADKVEFILFALSLLDRLRRFKLARDSKQKSEKSRQKITDIIQKTAFSQRQEAAQAKKEELRRLEKERIYNEDDPEKQRRWEKKEAKRELKKSKTRVKQLKVKSM